MNIAIDSVSLWSSVTLWSGVALFGVNAIHSIVQHVAWRDCHDIDAAARHPLVLACRFVIYPAAFVCQLAVAVMVFLFLLPWGYLAAGVGVLAVFVLATPAATIIGAIIGAIIGIIIGCCWPRRR